MAPAFREVAGRFQEGIQGPFTHASVHLSSHPHGHRLLCSCVHPPEPVHATHTPSLLHPFTSAFTCSLLHLSTCVFTSSLLHPCTCPHVNSQTSRSAGACWAQATVGANSADLIEPKELGVGRFVPRAGVVLSWKGRVWRRGEAGVGRTQHITREMKFGLQLQMVEDSAGMGAGRHPPASLPSFPLAPH